MSSEKWNVKQDKQQEKHNYLNQQQIIEKNSLN